ncbi:unnamed protein product [Allacma fusca]|uniref:Uncharacterized protein n=1 Tax=Allacma fusca TaxID=39272 RepID=A0A8J2LBT7_9HEXA|nr:unnamed protein product [Allacma fusca]
MRKPISQQDEQTLVSLSPTSSARRPSQVPPTGSIHAPRGDFREENNVQYTTASNRPRACLKLRECTNTFQHTNLLIPAYPFFPNKPPGINFDCKQNPSIRTRKLEIPGYNPILDGYSGGRVHQEPILSASAIMRTKDSKENKSNKKEALKESYRNNLGSCAHQHQDGTYSSTCFCNQQENNNYSQPPETYGEKGKKQGKLQKVKTRHPSKSIAMNLNDMIMGKKKPKAKRPVTSATDLSLDCTTKISTKIFSANKILLNRKDKENMLPILRNSGQNPCNSVCYNDKEGDPHSHNGCNGKNCSKCNTMAQKLKAQVQVAKTLQKQNGCLENIVTQKRNLVEQLTRQVRTLVRENQQLAKGCGKLPLETMLTTEPSAALPKIPTINLAGCSGSFSQLQMEGYNTDESGEDPRKTRTGKENGPKPSTSPKKTESTEKLEEAEKRLSNLNMKCENIQQNYNQVKKENQEINRFLTDLLYTLNARGYESITDHEGNMIDLYRCKGEAFLDLRGRDARQRAPAKRLAPQETLLKAVIGSQERIIQNLICQLEDHQKEALIGQRLSLDSFHCQEGSRNSILEADILSLFALIEGACQRSPEVYSVLKEQHAFDSQIKANAGMNVASAIVEAMLDRCQKVINSTNMNPSASPPATPPTPKPRREAKSSTTCQTRFVPMQNHLARGVVYNENPQYPHHLDPKLSVKQVPSQKSDPQFQKNGIPLPRGQILPEIPPRSRLPPQVTRSNSHTQAVGPLGPIRTNSPVLLANNMSSRGSSPRLRPNTSDNSINQQLTTAGHIQPMSVSSEKQIPSLIGDRCPYCTRQFSANTSLAEINAHMEIHSYQAG